MRWLRPALNAAFRFQCPDDSIRGAIFIHRPGSKLVLAAQPVLGFLDEDVAADVGDGIGERNLLGQASTQFCAKPHSWMPPSPARARRRSSLKTLPVGWLLKSLTWAMVAAPTKPVSSLNCGQTSMQQVQEMQLESG